MHFKRSVTTFDQQIENILKEFELYLNLSSVTICLLKCCSCLNKCSVSVVTLDK